MSIAERMRGQNNGWTSIVDKHSGISKSATSCECCCEDVSKGAQLAG